MAIIDWREALALERDVALLMVKQEKFGVYFNEGKAHFFISLLEKRKGEVYIEIRKDLSIEVINLEKKVGEDCGFVSKVRNKNGSYTKSVLSHYEDCDVVCGPFSRIRFEEPSLGKRALIINQLLKLGWKPEEFTEKGFPKLTNEDGPVDTLSAVGSFGKALSLWYIYSHRQSQIKGFLKHIRKDGRIAAICNSCATNTFRAKHKVVANIPRPSSIFGMEMRSLFSTREGRVWVGADASGLELRMLGHHMGDPDYIDLILTGDIHTHNQNLAGLPTRNDAKTFIWTNG